MRFWFAPDLVHFPINSEQAYLYVQQRVAEVGLPALETILEALKSDDADVRDLVCRSFGGIGVPAIEPLVEILRDERPEVRVDAVFALARIQDAQVIPHLLAALKDENGRVRSVAALCLGSFGKVFAPNSTENGVVEALCQALQDSDFRVANYAVLSLGEIGDARAVSALVRLLPSHPGSEVLKALGRIGDPGAVEALLPYLQRGNIDAIHALGEIGDVRALPLILQFASEYEPNRRHPAREALRTIQEKQRHLPRAVIAENRLSASVRFSVLVTLRWRYLLTNIPSLCRRLLKDKDAAVREGAQAILEYLSQMRALQNEQHLLRPASKGAMTPPEELVRSAESPPNETDP